MVEAPAHRKLRYFRLPPNLAHRKLIDLTNHVLSSRDSRNDFLKTEKNDGRCGTDLWRFLRKMKACIDEFWPNTSQANYFEEFWTITSKVNPEIEVRKKQESLCAIRRVGYVCHTY